MNILDFLIGQEIVITLQYDTINFYNSNGKNSNSFFYKNISGSFLITECPVGEYRAEISKKNIETNHIEIFVQKFTIMKYRINQTNITESVILNNTLTVSIEISDYKGNLISDSKLTFKIITNRLSRIRSHQIGNSGEYIFYFQFYESDLQAIIDFNFPGAATLRIKTRIIFENDHIDAIKSLLLLNESISI